MHFGSKVTPPTTHETRPTGRARRGCLAAAAVSLFVACQTGPGCASRSPSADHNVHNLQSRSTMPRFTIWTPGVVSSYAGAADLDIFALSAPGPRRVLHTTEFFQGGVELREMRSLTPVAWGVEVPEAAQLFSVTGGIVAGNAHQFWVGCRQSGRASSLTPGRRSRLSYSGIAPTSSRPPRETGCCS
jgi:hypothetical protein